MAEKKVLQLQFLDANGKQASISISGPKEGLTMEDVKKVADVIVEKAALTSATAVLTQYKGAKLITTITSELL